MIRSRRLQVLHQHGQDALGGQALGASLLMLAPALLGMFAYIALLSMAVHKPRLVIADAGRSFALLLDFFKTMGLSTYSVTLTSEADVSLPPFFHAHRLLQDEDVMSSYRAAERQARLNAGLPEDSSLDALLGGEAATDRARQPGGSATLPGPE